MYKDQEKEDNVNSTNNVNIVSLTVNAAGTNEVNAVGSKWVFRNKKDERGIVIRNKARLVTQEDGTFEYVKDFVHPVARIEAIRLFLALCFLFEDSRLYLIELLVNVGKALYVDTRQVLTELGRKSSVNSICWDNGFQRGKINKTLFIKMYKGDILLVQVYVDDIIFGSTKMKLCIAFEKFMHEKFQNEFCMGGELTFF
ncbi:putative ribonuclease H-like domain-containing protein [Tanacetum coccineum]